MSTTETRSPPLSADEKRRLAELEKVISGNSTFMEAAQALLVIKEEVLHRPLTFETYCTTRTHYTRSRAQQLVAAARIQKRLGIVLPAEGHYRALNRVPDDVKLLLAPQMVNRSVADAEEIVREYREKHAIGKTRNRHPRVVAVAEELGRLADRGKRGWTPEMCKDLTPPEARKQLTQISKAIAFLEEVREAVDYRAQTMHQWMGR